MRVPDNLHIQLTSSEIDETISFVNERWYKITSTKEDLKGEIISAHFFVKFQDRLRILFSTFYDEGWLSFLFIF